MVKVIWTLRWVIGIGLACEIMLTNNFNVVCQLLCTLHKILHIWNAHKLLVNVS